MNTRILVAALVGGIAFFLIGWLVWGILLMETMTSLQNPVAGCEREEPILWALFLGNFFTALLYSVVFDRWATISTFRGGLLGGMLLGGLMSIGQNLMMFAFMPMMTLPASLLDIVAATIVSGIVGGIVGAVLGYKRA